VHVRFDNWGPKGPLQVLGANMDKYPKEFERWLKEVGIVGTDIDLFYKAWYSGLHLGWCSNIDGSLRDTITQIIAEEESRNTPKPKPISYKDNWGHKEYYLGGQRVTNIRKVILDDKEVPILYKDVIVPVSDMGHRTDVETRGLFVLNKVYGIEHHIPLEKLLKSRAVYTLDNYVDYA
jgi:hypothetical protein